ncbi:MAG: hypothetical protein FWC94_01275 [Bacteroidales bacterium]|nr:hypothetical protein [Bacteroidales bacterium]
MKKILFTIAIISLLLAGCDKESNNGIDSEINITMMEDLSGAIQLYFSTTKIYPCMNYWIDLSWKRSSNNIDVTFKGVISPGVCLRALGPATETLNLGVLNNGTYQLSFYNRDERQSGELIVSSEGYRINFANNSLVHFRNIPLNRIPENTIWVVVSYNEENLLLSFLEAFMELDVTEKSNVTRGYYSFENYHMLGVFSGFKAENDGSITFLPSFTNCGVMLGRRFMRSFVFQNSESSANIEQLIRQHREQIEIRAFTDKGEQFMSWLMN